MTIVFQVILLFIIGISFLGIIGEKENMRLRNNLVSVCIAAIFAFVVSVMWL